LKLVNYGRGSFITLGSDNNKTKMAIFDKYLTPATYQKVPIAPIAPIAMIAPIGAPIGATFSDLPYL
jgi:hypothetical protein